MRNLLTMDEAGIAYLTCLISRMTQVLMVAALFSCLWEVAFGLLFSSNVC